MWHDAWKSSLAAARWTAPIHCEEDKTGKNVNLLNLTRISRLFLTIQKGKDLHWWLHKRWIIYWDKWGEATRAERHWSAEPWMSVCATISHVIFCGISGRLFGVQRQFLLHPFILPPANQSWKHRNQTNSLYQRGNELGCWPGEIIGEMCMKMYWLSIDVPYKNYINVTDNFQLSSLVANVYFQFQSSTGSTGGTKEEHVKDKMGAGYR